MKKILLCILFTFLLSPAILKANKPDKQNQVFFGENKQKEITENDSLIGISIYPNPSSSVVNFQFNLEEKAQVNIEIFNIVGRKVKTLHNSILKPGSYLFRWDGSSFDNGLYLYNFKVDDNVETGRLILRK